MEVLNVPSPHLILLKLDGKADILISDQARKEILPTVYAFVGSRESGVNRIAFEAPRDVPIFRQELK